MMSSSLLLIFATGICFALNALFIKMSGTKINALSGLVFWSLGIAIIGIIVFLFQKMRGGFNASFQGSSYAFLAGLAISIGIIFYLTAFSYGVEISFATPIVNTIGVLSSIVLGMMFFGEAITWYRLLGVSLAIISIYILSTS